MTCDFSEKHPSFTYTLQFNRGAQTLTESFITWCNHNHLKHNISKTNELVVDYQRNRRSPFMFLIQGEEAKKDLGAQINNWLAETSHWSSPQEETEQIVLTEETQDTKLIWNDLFNVIVPVVLDCLLMCKFTERITPCMCSHVWPIKRISIECEVEAETADDASKYGRFSREATNTKTWKPHTVSWRAPKISYQLRVRPHVKYGHSRPLWSWVMALSKYQKKYLYCQIEAECLDIKCLHFIILSI